MGATRQDIFGDGGGAQSATPGSYGQPPDGYRLPAATRIGGVRLQVGDLARSQQFYEEVLGLRVVERDAMRAVLSAQGEEQPLLELMLRKGARPAPRRGVLGLYHFAILVPDRPSLGRFVRHLGDIGAHAGSADHLVSEAFYLQDPDNLGIEVYVDRPRATWQRIDRQLMMATDPIDIADLVAAGGSVKWSGMPTGTVIGHVHLHVGDIDRAGAFYSDALGFDKMVWHYPGALFLGAGGYHHHLGTNTWAGPAAVPAPEDTARLVDWTIELPTTSDVDAVAASLAQRGHTVERDGAELLTRDPWETQLRIRSTD